MTIATLSWPAASIYIAAIVGVALVAAVLIHSIFRTGQTAIQSDSPRGAPSSGSRGFAPCSSSTRVSATSPRRTAAESTR